ncbi:MULTISPECIES: UDP-N-acetylglucosamine 2-epimerase [unclassified Viridibacillus]|uniref:UDP-N-acetylglucosamine 2-epimerase n=1 Tax=unclassified Viridibacillus TaxID=2617942 RepID=UPI00096F4717|nr:UDP-N-acetylglucosamine 2-epimerase [Viridibacillus sp. FSL H8-0123]OMC81683.1 UDP-N-acetylglucosamine 2-epimerase (hydrolyzing) [Viridibacillus sp. FSL H8-0123]
MKKKIHIITTSRADFTIWVPIIKSFINEKSFELKVIVTGTHYFSNLGETYKEVINKIDNKYLIEIPVQSNNSEYDFLAEMFVEYSEIISDAKKRPDFVLLLGDRYELLPILNALVLNRIAIGHLYPAECDVSYCIDTQIRDAITKCSHLLFVTHNDYLKRLLAMGEEEWRIAVVGNSNMENNYVEGSKSIYEFLEEKSIVIPSNFNLVNCCYHPPTIHKGHWKQELPILFNALDKIHEKNMYIWSGINSDPDSYEMKVFLLEEIKKRENHFYFDSLGGDNYKSLLSNSIFTIGNSSSGLYEAPLHRCPTINVGVRQSGRLHGDSVIDVKADVNLIINAINQVKTFSQSQFSNVFYQKEYPINIVHHIKQHIYNEGLMIKRLHMEEKSELRRVPDYL